MNAFCLDTSAYSQFKRGRPEVVELLARARRIVLPVIVLGELRYGFLKGSSRARNEQELVAFLRHPAIEICDVDDDVTTVYAEIMIQLKKAGTPLPSNDVWIAAITARQGLPLVTYDSDFLRIPRIGARVLE